MKLTDCSVNNHHYPPHTAPSDGDDTLSQFVRQGCVNNQVCASTSLSERPGELSFDIAQPLRTSASPVANDDTSQSQLRLRDGCVDNQVDTSTLASVQPCESSDVPQPLHTPASPVSPVSGDNRIHCQLRLKHGCENKQVCAPTSLSEQPGESSYVSQFLHIPASPVSYDTILSQLRHCCVDNKESGQPSSNFDHLEPSDVPSSPPSADCHSHSTPHNEVTQSCVEKIASTDLQTHASELSSNREKAKSYTGCTDERNEPASVSLSAEVSRTSHEDRRAVNISSEQQQQQQQQQQQRQQRRAVTSTHSQCSGESYSETRDMATELLSSASANSSQRESRAFTSTDSQGTDVSAHSWSFVKIIDLAELSAFHSSSSAFSGSVSTADDSVFHHCIGQENGDGELSSPDNDDVFAFTADAQAELNNRVSDDSVFLPEDALRSQQLAKKSATHFCRNALKQSSGDSKNDYMFQSVSDHPSQKSIGSYCKPRFLSEADLSERNFGPSDDSVFLSSCDDSKRKQVSSSDSSVFLCKADQLIKKKSVDSNDDAVFLSDEKEAEQKSTDSSDDSVFLSTSDATKRKLACSINSTVVSCKARLLRQKATDSNNDAVLPSDGNKTEKISTESSDDGVFLSEGNVVEKSTLSSDDSVFLSHTDTARQTSPAPADDCVFLPQVTPDPSTSKEGERGFRSLPRRRYRSHIRTSWSLANLPCREARRVLDQQYRMAAQLNSLRRSFHLHSRGSADSQSDNCLPKSLHKMSRGFESQTDTDLSHSFHSLNSKGSPDSQSDTCLPHSFGGEISRAYTECKQEEVLIRCLPRSFDASRASSRASEDSLFGGIGEFRLSRLDSSFSFSQHSSSVDSMTTNPSRSVLCCEAASVSMVTHASGSDFNRRSFTDSESTSLSWSFTDSPTSPWSSDGSGPGSISADLSKKRLDSNSAARSTESKTEHAKLNEEDLLAQRENASKTDVPGKSSVQSAVFAVDGYRVNDIELSDTGASEQGVVKTATDKKRSEATSENFTHSSTFRQASLDEDVCGELSGPTCGKYSPDSESINTTEHISNSERAATAEQDEVHSNSKELHRLPGNHTSNLRQRFYANSHLYKVLGSEDSFKASRATSSEREPSQGDDSSSCDDHRERKRDEKGRGQKRLSSGKGESLGTTRGSHEAKQLSSLEPKKGCSSRTTHKTSAQPSGERLSCLHTSSTPYTEDRTHPRDENRILVNPLFTVAAENEDDADTEVNKNRIPSPVSRNILDSRLNSCVESRSQSLDSNSGRRDKDSADVHTSVNGGATTPAVDEDQRACSRIQSSSESLGNGKASLRLHTRSKRHRSRSESLCERHSSSPKALNERYRTRPKGQRERYGSSPKSLPERYITGSKTCHERHRGSSARYGNIPKTLGERYNSNSTDERYSVRNTHTRNDTKTNPLRNVAMAINAGVTALAMVGFQSLYLSTAANVQRLREVIEHRGLCVDNSSKSHLEDMTVREMELWQKLQAEVCVVWLAVVALFVFSAFIHR